MIRRVFMHPVEVRLAREADPGFNYTFEKYGKGLDASVFVHIVRGPARRQSDEELTDDMVKACLLMIERACWQESMGTYRDKFPRWKARKLAKGTAFPGLVASQRGQIYWDMLCSARTREYELCIECPRCPERVWSRVVGDVEQVVSKQRSLRIEDIGYIVPKRTGEIVVVGKRDRLQKLPAILRPIFKEYAGTTARLRLSMSESKGTVYKLG
ncbi:MAG: hypothetical protein KF859_09305 [Phycisphaeraceae bacterium]|nr:hypothetical protein [Phycisphaeraceae bacterium]